MIIKYNIFDIGGTIIKDDEYCLARENQQLKDVNIYSYLLYKNKSTKRLIYNNDCIYMFVGGRGVFELEKDLIYVSHNDLILVSKNTHHKIINNGDIHMKFLMLKEK
jgi:mannose-6-phosphate isomerase-like protein (cupin superfamily)